MLEVYTDGSCKGNPGPGGWAAIIVGDGSKQVLQGGAQRTTNNRMEITAVIKALETLPEDIDVGISSDSLYVVNTMKYNWKRKANKDLWSRLDHETAKRRVSWRWVKGHDGDPLNEEADKMASNEAAKATLLETDSERTSLSHLDQAGAPQMVDVEGKPDTKRTAVARGAVVMRPDTLSLVVAGGFEKGDVLSIARIAGIMAAKNTSQLIPLCHPLSLTHVAVEITTDEQNCSVNIEAIVKTEAKTGVEMEAITAVSVAALTVYDMCKAVDRTMKIQEVRVVQKFGGLSGDVVLEE